MINKPEYKDRHYVVSDGRVLDIEFISNSGTPFAEYHCRTMDGKNIELRYYAENLKPFWVQRGDVYEIDREMVYVVMELEFKKATGLVVRGVLGEHDNMKQFLKDAGKPRKWSTFSLDKLSNFELIHR